MRIVQKFGGTSVADIGRLENVALKVKQEVDAGHQVAVIVSAMAGVTNQLVTYVKALAGSTQNAEYDAVVSTGEQITTGLLALALQQIGIPARSLMGWQIPLYTDKTHGKASIKSINPKSLEECWNQGMVPVIAGFQGITRDRRITTLGRGGSDTTAVAIAAAVRADRCDIYTDVDGVYTADPRIVPLAQKLDYISYSEMLALASLGAKVLHAPCVDLAMKEGVKVRVLSSFENHPGTDIIHQENNDEHRISGITYTAGWVLLYLHARSFISHPSLENQSQELLKQLKKKAVPAEMALSSGISNPGYINIIIPQSYLATVIQIIEDEKIKPQNKQKFHFPSVTVKSGLAKVSVVGLNLVFKNGFNDQLLKIINRQEMYVTIMSLTAQKFCLCIEEDLAPNLIRNLHHHFGLDKITYEDTQDPLATRL